MSDITAALSELRESYAKELADLKELRPTLKHQTPYSTGAADQAEALLRRFVESLDDLQGVQAAEDEDDGPECGCLGCVTCGECSSCDPSSGCPDCNGSKTWPAEP